MTYYEDVYKKRGAVWGATSNEKYLNYAKKYFADYILTSPNSGTVTVNGVSTSAAVQDNKDDPNKISKYFLISVSINVIPGHIIVWDSTNWLVVQKEQKNFEAYNKVMAFKCNDTLKWVDDYGILKTTPCYLFSSMASTVQDAFKAANGLIFPQSNKNLEIILPYFLIRNEQRFLIKNESWKVIDRDLVSAQGILYVSLVEDLVDSFEDDTTNNIAGYKRLNNSYIDLGVTSVTLALNGTFKFNPILYNDDKVIENSLFTYTSVGKDKEILLNGNTITAIKLGTTVVKVCLTAQPDLFASCTVVVASSGVSASILQLVGDESIKWGRTRTYTTFHNTGSTPTEIASTFTLIGNSSNLVTLTVVDSHSCSLIANQSGLSGTITLRATTAQGVVDKIISVVSVW